MKTLKNVIAYINWQQYAFADRRYELPKTLCSTFWLTVFGVIMLPLTIWGNVWNAIKYSKTVKNRDYESYQDDLKVNCLVGAMLHVLLLVFGGIVDLATQSRDLFNWITMSNMESFGGILTNYVAAIGLGIMLSIILFIAFFIVGLIVHFIIEAKDSISDWFTVKKLDAKLDSDLGDKSASSSFGTKMIQLYFAFKNKFCPRIDWTDVTKGWK